MCFWSFEWNMNRNLRLINQIFGCSKKSKKLWRLSIFLLYTMLIIEKISLLWVMPSEFAVQAQQMERVHVVSRSCSIAERLSLSKRQSCSRRLPNLCCSPKQFDRFAWKRILNICSNFKTNELTATGRRQAQIWGSRWQQSMDLQSENLDYQCRH